MISPVMRFLTSVVFSPLLAVTLSFGQSAVSGSFNGTISDATGAVIAGATVRIVNTGTGVSQQTTSDTSGVYQFRDVSPGTYDITASFKGFNTVVKQGAVLLVNQPATVDFILKPGTVSQQVTVHAEVQLINTVNSTVGTVVQQQQVVNLPLNGRQFTQLILLTPGAAPRGTTQQTAYNVSTDLGSISPAVNGGRPDSNNFTMDGVENNALWFNTVAISPPPDAIQEFKIQSFMTGGGFGRAPGVNINVVTRSGTNQIHGTAWEFVRNDIFDARNTFNTSKSKFRQNQFGGDIGLPIRRDKLWTFGYYEGFRKILGSTGLAVVPTAAMLNGDLSSLPEQIFNPFSTKVVGTDSQGNPIFARDPFVNNQIPNNLLNPVALAVAKRYYPTANIANAAPGTPNFLNTQPFVTPVDQYSDRTDAVLPMDTRFFARFTRLKGTRATPDALSTVPAAGTTADNIQATVGLTKSLSSTTVADFHAQFLRTHEDLFRQPAPLSFLQSSGVLIDYPGQQGIRLCVPNIAISDANGIDGCDSNYNFVNSWEYNGSVTKIHGRHSITAGFEWYRMASPTNFGYADASFDNLVTSDPQNSATTGSGLASFLLGTPKGGDREQGQGGQVVYGDIYSPWFNDEVRVTHKLTLTLGLRYDYGSTLSDTKGRFGAPDWQKSTPNHVVYDVDSTALKFPSQIETPDHTLQAQVSPFDVVIDPHHGLQLPTKDDFGPRVGIAYQLPHDMVIRTGYAVFYEFNQSLLQSQDDVTGQFPFGAPNFTLDGLNRPTAANPMPTGVLGQNDIFPPLVLSYTPPTSTGFAILEHNHTPYVQQWNLGIQKEFPDNWALTVDYLGTKGTDLGGRFAVNVANTPGPGPLSARQPIPQIGVLRVDPHIFNSSYNAAEAKLEHRLTRGVTMILAYAYSHSIDDVSCTHADCGKTQNVLDYRASRGSSDYDIRHNLVTSWVWQLPAGRGQRYFASGGLASGLLGGWQASGIASLESGMPINLFVGSDNANVGFGQQRPSITSLHDLLPSGFQQNRQHWFNTNAVFVVPFTYGNIGRNALLRRAGYKDLDFSLTKITPLPVGWLAGHDGANIEFRAEFFNIFNHQNFADPVNTFSRNDFGQVESIVGTPRDIQFAMKFNF